MWRFLFLMLLVSSSALAFRPYENVRVIEVSSTGNSVLLDLGEIEGVAMGDFAIITRQRHRDDVELQTIMKVGEAEAVRVKGNQSMWLFHDMGAKESLEKGEEVQLSIFKSLNDGRRLFKTLQHHVYASKEDQLTLRKESKSIKRQVPRRYVKQGRRYDRGEEIYREDFVRDEDLETFDFAEMEVIEGQHYFDRYNQEKHLQRFKGIDDVIRTGVLKEHERKLISRSMVDSQEYKLAEEPWGVRSLYKDINIDPRNRQISDNTTAVAVYDVYVKDKKEKERIHPRVQAKLESGDYFWPSDLTDQQLRKYFIQSGLAREERRKKLSLETETAYEFFLQYQFSTLNHTDADGTGNNTPVRSLYFGYEWHLMNTAPSLRDWSLMAGYEISRGNYDFGPINAFAEDRGMKFALNYYINGTPATVGRYIFYLGTGFKIGKASVLSERLSQPYEYGVLTAPYGHLGVKYRWLAGDEARNDVGIGAGWHASVAADSTEFTAKGDLNDNIRSSIRVNDIKFSLGLSVFF